MGSAVAMVVIGLLALWVILSGKGLATWQVWTGTAPAAPTAAQSTAVLGA